MFFKIIPQKIILTSSRAQEESLNLMLLSDLHSPDNFLMNEVNSKEFDLVLTLGDINESTIDYILFNGRSVYVYGVYGNQDQQIIPGLNSLDGKILVMNGYKISGISGVNQYYRCAHSYSESAVERKLKRLGRVDILIAHVPPYSISKNEDRAHQGFKALDNYIARHKPKYVFYGHLNRNQRDLIGETIVVGVTGKEFVRIKS